MKIRLTTLIFGLCLFLISNLCALRNNDTQTITPIVFLDSVSKLYFYVESDGRHVSAFTSEGTLLWNRDLFVDAKLEPYRFTKPVILSIERKNNLNGIIMITFNSTQMISIDANSGEPTILGRR